MKNDLYKQNTGNLADKVSSDEPGLCRIVLHNDDFTPMEFVIEILEKVLFLDRRQAAAVMMEAHQNGKAVCGLFVKDVAESKQQLIIDLARESEHPLVCSMEAA